MKILYNSLLKAKEKGYWSAKVNETKDTLIHTLYYKEKNTEEIILDKEPSVEIPVLEFETPANVSYYDFSYPVKVYLEPTTGLKGCVRFKDDIRVEGLEEFKKIVFNKVLEVHSSLEVDRKSVV